MLTHFKVPQYLLLLMFSLSVMSESFVTLWSVVHQVPLSVGYPREEYWSGLPFPSPGDLPDPGIEPTSPALAGRFYTTYAMLSHFSRFWLCATPQTAAHQAPPSLGFSRQEHWSGLPFPSPGDLPDPGIEPTSPALAADSIPSRYTLKWLSPELNVCVVRTERWSQKGKALAVIQSRCSIFCYFL